MALFDIPGWEVQASVSTTTITESPSTRKKRRRSGEHDSKHQLVANAAQNLQKLMGRLQGGETSKASHKKSLKPLHSSGDEPMERQKKRTKKSHSEFGAVASNSSLLSQNSKGNSRKKNMRKDRQEPSDSKRVRPAPKASKASEASNLSQLQGKMRKSLDGARFRFVNELMYTSESTEAHSMMREDPEVFEEYHTGFRSQCESWPTNPVTYYQEKLSKLPKGAVIADLGCGDAALAKSLVPQGYTVMSYDLVSRDPYVVEADICSRLPLPGSEQEDEGQVVDVCVLSLSLMSTNWISCLREAWRVLKPGGQLDIAEVTSRITDVAGFVTLLKSLGFQLTTQDAENTHFTLFAFKKVKRTPMTDESWADLVVQGSLLKPCEYKRR